MTRFALFFAALGCASPSPQPRAQTVNSETGGALVEAESVALSPRQEARIRFSLERASLPEVARLLGSASELRIVLDASVDAVAECLTISVFEPNLITVDEAIAITREAYASRGVVLERSADQLRFSLANDAPAPCLPTRAVRRQPRTPPPTPPSQAAANTSTLSPLVDSGIRQVSANEVMITRQALNEVLANQQTLLRAARLIPHQENGRVVSIKIYGIRRSSLLGRLGFQNGDGIQRLNGHDLTSPDSALEAYARSRSASVLRVELQRRGQAVVQTIRIVASLP
ncbi:MAG: type II secretion system protein GspC [Myxococcota bacterium]